MSGGTSTCTYDLLNAMHRQGSDVDLMTVQTRNPNDRLMGCGEDWIKALPNDCKSPYGYSANMTRFLNDGNYDIYHTNGLWMHVNHVTCSVARRKGRPYVITPHGMLYPEALHRSYWKKWPLIQLFFRRDILRADCLHVTCKKEMEMVRLFGYKGAVAVIANPVPFPDYVQRIYDARRKDFLGCNRPKSFGFLGRLHPIKKVENLLYGMSRLPEGARDTELLIMGKGDAQYEQFLHSEAERLKLKNVRFLGFVRGEEKYRVLSELSCLFVPSDMENFGMIVTEALSVGTPVMASLGTPWEELNSHDCGWWVDRAPESVAAVMEEVLSLSPERLLEMGSNGRRLVEEKYTDTKVAQQMQELYDWIAGGKRPDFVFE